MGFVEAYSGDRFHLWGLPDASSPEPVDFHEYTMLINELAGGYRQVRRLGLADGLRSWKLSLPTLAGGTLMPLMDDVGTGIVGTVSREQYLRNLFAYNRAQGLAIAYLFNGKYYLTDIENDALNMVKKKGVEIYSTEITLRERRLPGIVLPPPPV